MLNNPRFKPHLRVQTIPGEGVFVLSAGREALLRGRLYEQVVPLVDGHTPDEICERLSEQVSAAEVYFTLGQLEKKGYLCEDEVRLPAAQAALWSAQQVDPGTAARRLAETTVSVQAFGVDATALCGLLLDQGIRVQDDGALAVILVDGYLRAELEACNADALRHGRPWLLARPRGRQVWIGPLFRPGLTGCWACLAARLRANGPVSTYVDAKTGRTNAAEDPACTPATLHLAHGLIAHAVASWIACAALPALEGAVQTLDVTGWQMQAHTLVRLPHCRACASGTAAPATAAPVMLQSRPKTFTSDGGHRVVAPEATLSRYGRHVSPLTGAVSVLERVAVSGDGALHVYVAGHNLARRHRSLDHLRGDLRNSSSGKGVTDLQARASGLCEGLERYSGVFRGNEPRRRARLRDLGCAALHPNDCMLISDQQYQERAAWNARPSAYAHVPVPFDPDAEIDWTPVWSLSRGEERYLPTAFCYYSYPYGNEEPYCVACSNGSAAGNTLEEAILQGFFELVERDSVALWWYSRARRPAIDLDSFDDSYLDRLRAFLTGRKRQLWALDLTSDLNVPVFAAVCRQGEGPEERIVLGFGAHLDARIALLRAVTEMNQMLSWLLREGDQEMLAEQVTDAETVHWLRTATVANQPYLLPDPATPERAARDYPRTWSDDVAEDVRACQALVEQKGLEMLVLDQTRSEIGLPVVKTIVPGLRHFWARFAPGRLYDVPVRLGWLPRRLTEKELNPIPMFL